MGISHLQVNTSRVFDRTPQEGEVSRFASSSGFHILIVRRMLLTFF